MKIAIMQPTFLPWLGYFGMIHSVDEFVFFDSVQFNKRSWQQRNKIKTSVGETFLSVSVLTKGKEDKDIKNILLDPEHFIPEKMLATISQNYQKAPYFKDYYEGMRAIFLKGHTHLSDFNIDLIEYFCQQIGIKTKFSRSSSMPVNGAKADLLADICSHLKGNVYLSAPGSREYIEESTAFQDRGIEVIYNNYTHPVYQQQYQSDFIPYLCIADLLFNEGPKSMEILMSGYKS